MPSPMTPDEDILIRRQDEVRVFANQAGGITIIEADPMQNEDSIVVIPVHAIAPLIKRLRELERQIRRGAA